MNKLFSTTVFLLISIVALKASPKNIIEADTQSKITYTISIDQHNPKIARVQLSFIPQDSLLYMTQGAGQFPDRWATFIHHLEVINAEGKVIAIKDLPDAQWILPYTPKEEIKVSYEVRLDHDQHQWGGGLDGVAYTTDWGVFYAGRALLVFNGADWEDIRVNFSLPDRWKASTPWERAGENSFQVHNQMSLMQSMIFAGTHEEVTISEGDFELIFALGGEQVLAEREEFKNLAGGVLDYYVELMDGLPNPPPGQVLDRCLVIINSSDSTDGEVIGSSISILIEKDGDQMAKMISRFVFAHEFFHLWNGKSFMPDDSETEWFKEGFSNYYTLKALHHVGFLNDQAYFGVLNNLFYQRYASDSGIGNLAMIRGEEKHAHWGLIYGGGLFVALAQDIMIRETTRNTKSVDDLMRKFFKRYGGTHDHYVIDDLKETLDELNGKDQSQFFQHYIQGTKILPIADYLGRAGLDARIEENALKISNKEDISSLQKAIIGAMLGDLD
ncbi:MAG: hypothetical protein AB3N14_09915 [Flavobacteriaceae bacterium]